MSAKFPWRLLIPPALALLFMGGAVLAVHWGGVADAPPAAPVAPAPAPARQDVPRYGLQTLPRSPAELHPLQAGQVGGALAAPAPMGGALDLPRPPQANPTAGLPAALRPEPRPPAGPVRRPFRHKPRPQGGDQDIEGPEPE